MKHPIVKAVWTSAVCVVTLLTLLVSSGCSQLRTENERSTASYSRTIDNEDWKITPVNTGVYDWDFRPLNGTAHVSIGVDEKHSFPVGVSENIELSDLVSALRRSLDSKISVKKAGVAHCSLGDVLFYSIRNFEPAYIGVYRGMQEKLVVVGFDARGGANVFDAPLIETYLEKLYRAGYLPKKQP